MWMIWTLLLLAASAAAVVVQHHRQLRALEPEAKKQLLETISRFADFLPVLLLLLSREDSRHTKTLLKQWRRRMCCTPALRDYFDRRLRCKITSLAKGRLWLQTLKRWGVEHDHRNAVVTITEDIQELYIFDDIYQLGDAMRVLESAWWVTRDGRRRCIRRGAAEVLEEETL
ncbi:MAG: hypothetical protein J6J12_03945 [Oscillospiraceae bacterium]|nr:hypothetical protein [Oscillospiraceae bacterium]